MAGLRDLIKKAMKKPKTTIAEPGEGDGSILPGSGKWHKSPEGTMQIFPRTSFETRIRDFDVRSDASLISDKSINAELAQGAAARGDNQLAQAALGDVEAITELQRRRQVEGRVVTEEDVQRMKQERKAKFDRAWKQARTRGAGLARAAKKFKPFIKIGGKALGPIGIAMTAHDVYARGVEGKLGKSDYTAIRSNKK